ncbi:MAG: peptide deformylase [Egibacteraceae bacterium]
MLPALAGDEWGQAMANNGVEIDGEALRALRSDRMWSLQRLARQGRDFAASIGENTGLVGPTLCRAERGKHDPSRDTLRYVVGALRPTLAQLHALLKGAEPPKALVELCSDAPLAAPDNPTPPTAAGEDDGIDRRHALRGSAGGTGPARTSPSERATRSTPARQPHVPDLPAASGTNLIVEHDDAELRYADGVYHLAMRRLLRNVGTEPITRFLIRISVDRYPGEPERSNQLYRAQPLTWEELSLTARCDGEEMSWKATHDRDAFKEVWLLFENEERRFPLYPGEATWIDYAYTVGDAKWGPWFQRAVRLPTRRLSVRLVFPAALEPVVWGTESSMAAESVALRTAIGTRDEAGTRVFEWATHDPPLHARYRLEWRFDACRPDEERERRASARMRTLGIVQDGAPILRLAATPFDLPRDADIARGVIERLVAYVKRLATVHVFGKGMGLAAPQIGIGRAAAIVHPPGDAAEPLVLLNPRVVGQSEETDEQYEGCLSFFDVRGMVPRPLWLRVAYTTLAGEQLTVTFERAVARLVAHEVDHLHGLLYTDRMRPDVTPIPVEQYRGTGAAWTY